MNAPEILGRLSGVHRCGSGWRSLCPAHEDRSPSLSISLGDDGRTLLFCHAGCTQEAVVDAVGMTMASLFPSTTGESQSPSPDLANAQTHPVGCTLRAYADAKGLDEAWLRSLGVSDATWPAKGGAPAVRIPYHDADGAEVSVRYRISVEGPDRFRWRHGSKPLLYGLDRLGRPTRRGALAALRDPVALVEGESDCHTLWHAGFAAVGLPGANSWRETWARDLDGVAEIHVVVEPDDGGRAVLGWLAKSSIRDRVRLVYLEGAKDASEFYLSDPSHFGSAGRQLWKPLCRSPRSRPPSMSTRRP